MIRIKLTKINVSSEENHFQIYHGGIFYNMEIEQYVKVFNEEYRDGGVVRVESLEFVPVEVLFE